MDKIKLGKSTVLIPPIGIGTWAWGTGFNGGDKIFGHHLGVRELTPVFRAAREAGLTFFDTAAVYGMGAAETILGRLLREVEQRREMVIAAKFTPMPIKLTAACMRRNLRESLARLGLEYLDLYQIHLPAGLRRWVPVLADLYHDGLVQSIGLSNFTLDQVREAEDLLRERGLRVHAVQNHFSLLYRAHETAGLLQWCRQNQVAFLAYMVLEQGLLTGRFTPDNPPPRKTRRGRVYKRSILEKTQPLLRVLSDLGAAHDRAPAEVAINWAMAKGAVPLVGATRPAHVQGCVNALSFSLSETEVAALDDAAARTGLSLKAAWEPRLGKHYAKRK